MTRLLGSVYAKTLRDDRGALLGWSIGIALLSLLMASFWPTVEARAEEFEKLLEGYPPAFRVFFGDVARIGTPEGFLEAELFSFLLPLLFLLYAVRRGADAVAGEEERGTADLLLAHPVTRRAVVLQKAAAILTGLGILAIVLLASLLAFGAVFGMALAADRVAAVVLLLALLAAAFGALALLLSAATGRKALAAATVAAVAFAGFLLDGLPQLVEWLEPARVLSPFFYYLGGEPLSSGLDWRHAGALAASAAVLALAAAPLFEGRDVRS